MNTGEVTLQLQKQSCERVSITLDLIKLLIISSDNAAEVCQQCLPLKDIRVVIDL